MDIERIKTLLKERHMTFEELATQMGKERSVVYKTISNGNPTLKFLQQLSAAMNLPIDAIVSTENAPSETSAPVDTIDGFVEVNGVTYRIHSKDDIGDLYNHLYNTL